ncbi:MAG: hypothetical protein JNN04_06810 [Cyclobacteriaceae bacterium]|nr:hypothetical protein [Cyclobacteriaceae bacterium]
MSEGTNKNKDLEETSGLVASQLYPGCFWAHNDSGHPAELFLLDSTAQTRASFLIAGAKNRDWEDIARLTIDSTSMLFIGDIGDNNRQHGMKVIYCVPEPDSLEGITELIPSRTLWIRLSGGYRDLEALMADPTTKNLYLISKREYEVNVYEIAYPYPEDTLEVAPILQLPLSQITAADISADGSEILIKNYNEVYYWKRLPGQRIAEVLSTDPISLPYEQEPQGESITWALDGSGYYTLSENGKGERGRLYFYARTHRRDSAASPR